MHTWHATGASCSQVRLLVQRCRLIACRVRLVVPPCFPLLITASNARDSDGVSTGLHADTTLPAAQPRPRAAGRAATRNANKQPELSAAAKQPALAAGRRNSARSHAAQPPAPANDAPGGVSAAVPLPPLQNPNRTYYAPDTVKPYWELESVEELREALGPQLGAALPTASSQRTVGRRRPPAALSSGLASTSSGAESIQSGGGDGEWQLPADRAAAPEAAMPLAGRRVRGKQPRRAVFVDTADAFPRRSRGLIVNTSSPISSPAMGNNAGAAALPNDPLAPLPHTDAAYSPLTTPNRGGEASTSAAGGPVRPHPAADAPSSAARQESEGKALFHLLRSLGPLEPRIVIFKGAGYVAADLDHLLATSGLGDVFVLSGSVRGADCVLARSQWATGQVPSFDQARGGK